MHYAEAEDLDTAVLEAMGYKHFNGPWWAKEGERSLSIKEFEPCLNWQQGGPIIEREKIEVSPTKQRTGKHSYTDAWTARYPYADCDGWPGAETGSTPLIAAMRAFVTYKRALAGSASEPAEVATK